jgi:biotin synthase
VGEKTEEEYRRWKEAGADRYLLKLETTNPALYARLHPGMDLANRMGCLEAIAGLDYQTGSGIIVGLPGQTAEDVERDLVYLGENDFGMISVSPFIPHPGTPLGNAAAGDMFLARKAVAVTRLLAGYAHMPAVSALAAGGHDKRPLFLESGANVVMLNFTPGRVQALYDIYPSETRTGEDPGETLDRLRSWACSRKRKIDLSRGDVIRVRERRDIHV